MLDIQGQNGFLYINFITIKAYLKQILMFKVVFYRKFTSPLLIILILGELNLERLLYFALLPHLLSFYLTIIFYLKYLLCNE